MKKGLAPFLAGIVALSHGLAPVALANPSFSHTEAGGIRIEESGGLYEIFSEDRSIGAFHSFSNRSGELIRSTQASPDHTALFRVIGGEPSTILGGLSANSRIFLINPNGILFGSGSQVNAPGLVASALDLASEDFLAGKYAFRASNSTSGGYVLNQGSLNGGGYIALIGRSVANEGMITANDIALAAGEKVRFALDAEGLVNVDIEAGVLNPVTDFDGKVLPEAVRNSGVIRADGGQVLLSAKAETALFDSIINHDGVIEARSVDSRNGRVILTGGDEGVVRVTGTIDASGQDAGETGGEVRILGEKVGLFDDANINVSGHSGGGTALIGGDYRGGNPLIPNATATFVGENAVILAGAIERGDGGRVIVWSDESTRVYGTIDAPGGALSGDGGFVETSGQYLDVAGIVVNAASPSGTGGLWLLDPYNVTISGASSGGGGFSGGSPDVWTPTNTGSNVLNTDINSRLNAGTSVTISTTGGGGELGNLTVSAAISKTAGGNATLMLDADNLLTVNSGISSTTGALTVILDATGHVDVNAAISTNGGNFQSDGMEFDNTGGTISTGAGNVTINNTSDITIGAAVTTAGNFTSVGNIFSVLGASVTGTGASSLISINTTQINLTGPAAGALRQTSTGNITLVTSGNINLDDYAVVMQTGTLSMTAGGNLNGGTNNSIAEINSLGVVTLSADNIGNTTVFDVTNASRVNMTSTVGGITFESLGDLTVGSITAAGSVNIQSSGKILSFAADGTADISGVSIILDSDAGGIGTSAAHLDITATGTLSADTTTDNSDIFIDSIGNLVVAVVDAGSGDVTLHSTGSINGNTNNNVAEILGADLSLTAVSGGIGQSTVPEIRVSGSLSANTSDNADITLEGVSGDMPLGLINAGTGDVTLSVASIDSILDGNAGALNIAASTLTVTIATNVGTSANPIEIDLPDFLGNVNTSAITGTAYFVDFTPPVKDTAGLTLVNGKITGGENIEELTSSLYGEENEDEEESSEDSEQGPAGAEDAVAQPAMAPDVPPLSERTFAPCSIL